MRRTKAPPSGSSGGRKKPYYLEEAMQFCLPYIRTGLPPSSGNLPSIPQTQPFPVDEEIPETQDDDSVFLDEDIAPQFAETYTSTQPSQSTTSLLSKKNSGQSLQKQKRNSGAVADLSVAEYFKAKKAKLQSNAGTEADTFHSIDKSQGLKLFLLSLLPELEDLSDSKIKLFKRKVLRLIDDLADSASPMPIPQRTFTTLVPSPSPSPSDSTLSHMSHEGPNSTNDFYTSFSQSL